MIDDTWGPGERQAYHAISLGFYEGELIRRVEPTVALRAEITPLSGASEPSVLAREPWQSEQYMVCVPTAPVLPKGRRQGILDSLMPRRARSRPVAGLRGGGTSRSGRSRQSGFLQSADSRTFRGPAGESA